MSNNNVVRYIPKIIHYCWFGGNPLPDHLKQFIDGWRKIMPDYEIIEWNESNFDISKSIDYVKEAYEAKKYAFVSDYVRVYALVNYGGIYFDTDIEMIKPLDDIIGDVNLLCGFETSKSIITAVMACDKGNAIMREFLNSYQIRCFTLEDGSYDLTTINERYTKLLSDKGVIMDNTCQTVGYEGGVIKVYSLDYFAGNDMEHSHLKVTSNTYTIHRFAASWKDKMSLKVWFKYRVVARLLQKWLGYDKYDKMIDKKHKKR